MISSHLATKHLEKNFSKIIAVSFPIHEGDVAHWTLGRIMPQERKALFYDSLSGLGSFDSFVKVGCIHQSTTNPNFRQLSKKLISGISKNSDLKVDLGTWSFENVLVSFKKPKFSTVLT